MGKENDLLRPNTPRLPLGRKLRDEAWASPKFGPDRQALVVCNVHGISIGFAFNSIGANKFATRVEVVETIL